MKNISRRVFIKGLAVAGVAAAASTILAGCNTNMIPGVDDGKDDEVTEPAATNKYTFTNVDGKTLVISAPSVVTSAKDTSGKVNVVIPATVENHLGDKVAFADELPAATDVATTGAAAYLVVLSAKVSDKDGNTLTGTSTALATAGDTTSWKVTNLLNSAPVNVGDGVSAPYAMGFKNTTAMVDWGKIVITAKVYKKVKTADDKKYAYSRTETDKYEFTYVR